LPNRPDKEENNVKRGATHITMLPNTRCSRHYRYSWR